jgi:hypothetical protein
MAAAITAASVVFFINSFGFPVVGNAVSAGFWPRIVSILLFVSSGMATYEAIAQYRLEHANETKEQRREKAKSDPDYYPWGTKRMLGTCALFGLYMIVGLNAIGFILATLIFIAALTIWLGNKKYWQAVINGVAATAACTVLFCKIMMIPLPRGTGIFRAFSLLFY